MNKKDYFKKRDSIMDKFNRNEISYLVRNDFLKELSRHYKHEWGNELLESTYTEEVTK